MQHAIMKPNLNGYSFRRGRWTGSEDGWWWWAWCYRTVHSNMVKFMLCLFYHNFKKLRGSCCGAKGSTGSWEHRDTQWVKDPVLLPLWLRSQLWLECDPWPGNSKQNKTKQNKKNPKSIWLRMALSFQNYVDKTKQRVIFVVRLL